MKLLLKSQREMSNSVTNMSNSMTNMNNNITNMNNNITNILAYLSHQSENFREIIDLLKKN